MTLRGDFEVVYRKIRGLHPVQHASSDRYDFLDLPEYSLQEHRDYSEGVVPRGVSSTLYSYHPHSSGIMEPDGRSPYLWFAERRVHARAILDRQSRLALRRDETGGLGTVCTTVTQPCSIHRSEKSLGTCLQAIYGLSSHFSKIKGCFVGIARIKKAQHEDTWDDSSYSGHHSGYANSC